MPQLPNSEEPLILLVEDREDDILLIRKAFERAKIKTPFQVARNGEEAIEYLTGTRKYKNRAEYPLPWLILLDLKLPGMSGFDLLAWVRKQPDFRSIVIVVLTSSEQLWDVNNAYQLGANSFMVKPMEFDDAKNLANLINKYWMQRNRFPEAIRERKVNGGKGHGP